MELWTPELKETIRVLYQSGMKIREIADKLNSSSSQIKGVIHRMGLSEPRAIPQRPRRPLGSLDDYNSKIPLESRKSLLELKSRLCRWPIGDPLREGFYFCGQSCEKIYCHGHEAFAYKRDDS